MDLVFDLELDFQSWAWKSGVDLFFHPGNGFLDVDLDSDFGLGLDLGLGPDSVSNLEVT